ncbi:MAG: hypothetical protein GC200_01725 [Tepidisphaera sp.]|nr:hypothetical protein [Tepidisphaera sp.]
MSTRRLKCVLGVAVCVAGALGGCSATDNSPEGIRYNLTPELQTMWQRPVDVGNQVSVTYDENIRMFWEDLHRGALVDRPTHLSKYPSPY